MRNMQWEMASSKRMRDLGIHNRTSSRDSHNGQRIYCSSLHVTNPWRTVRFVSKCGRRPLTVIFSDRISWIDSYDRRSLTLDRLMKRLRSKDRGLTNLWHTERSLRAALTAVPISFISFARPVSLYCQQHEYVWLRTVCIWTAVTNN